MIWLYVGANFFGCFLGNMIKRFAVKVLGLSYLVRFRV